MRVAILLTAILFVIVHTREIDEERVNALFNDWASLHNKEYVTLQEREHRFQNFKASISRIASLNDRTAKRGVGATYGLNKFSDLSPEEFAATILMKPFIATDDTIKRQNSLPTKQEIKLPNAFDWRTSSKVTAVKDQQQCGSCWAFSVTENIESVWMVNKNLTAQNMQPLSPQQIVDCDDSDYGCDGGNPPTAYDYIKSSGGLESEKDYPYTATDGTCNFLKADVVATISNFRYATTSYDETTLKNNLVNWAALSICVDARYWQDYEKGVLTAYECDWIVELDHCVQAVGYDLTGSTPYWIVRNSWGTTWGVDGYILLEYGKNTCGLTEEATCSVV